MEVGNKQDDYRLNGWHKVESFDQYGDFTTIEYFASFDGTIYSDLRVKETRTYTRDIDTKLVIQRDILIEWFIDGIVAGTKTLTKYYTAQKGYTANKKGRENLINDASMYLFSQVGKTDATEFFKIVKGEVEDYIKTSDMALITAINASTETYMTATIKATLTAILNVTY